MKSFAIFYMHVCVCVCVCVWGGGGGGDFSHDWIIFDEAFLFVIGTKI